MPINITPISLFFASHFSKICDRHKSHDRPEIKPQWTSESMNLRCKRSLRILLITLMTGFIIQIFL